MAGEPLRRAHLGSGCMSRIAYWNFSDRRMNMLCTINENDTLGLRRETEEAQLKQVHDTYYF